MYHFSIKKKKGERSMNNFRHKDLKLVETILFICTSVKFFHCQWFVKNPRLAHAHTHTIYTQNCFYICQPHRDKLLICIYRSQGVRHHRL